jgi:Na+-translocating ferredoxin:NAD+ oxidoreductase subunit B
MIAASALVAIVVAIGVAVRHLLTLLRLPKANLETRINAILPQTQCGLCGFNGCRPYAHAIATGEADIDRCPPGGDAGVRQLARLLKIAAKPVDRNRGASSPGILAVIDETRCIGCTLCIQACPVDAIIGAAKQMHTVLSRNCTGCELCIPPCPVDCIDMRAEARVHA